LRRRAGRALRRRAPSAQAASTLVAVALAALALAAAAAGGAAPDAAPPPAPRADSAAPPAARIAVAARAVAVQTPPGARARVLGALALSADHPRFGGFSGLALDPDGAGFTAVSDRGWFLTGRLTRDGGALSGVTDARLHPMRDPRGRAVAGDQADAEGLAQGADGALFVSFEGDARVWRYAHPDAPAVALPVAPAFRRLQRNSGLEALAITHDGALLTIPERSGALDRPFPVFRLDPDSDSDRRQGALDSDWRKGALPRDPPLLPTGADVAPDGMLYVLERDFSWLGGFSTRLRRASLADWPALRPETLFTQRGGLDNMEGLASWRDDSGAVRLVMIADDNFSPLQRTVLMELRLE